MPVKCQIYRSSKREELYLFVPERDRFEQIPASLMAGFGRPVFVMELELTPERRLARSDVREVMRLMAEQGYYLQMPPPPEQVFSGRRAE